jgi:hypothetical protein
MNDVIKTALPLVIVFSAERHKTCALKIRQRRFKLSSPKESSSRVFPRRICIPEALLKNGFLPFVQISVNYFTQIREENKKKLEDVNFLNFSVV